MARAILGLSFLNLSLKVVFLGFGACAFVEVLMLVPSMSPIPLFFHGILPSILYVLAFAKTSVKFLVWFLHTWYLLSFLSFEEVSTMSQNIGHILVHV